MKSDREEISDALSHYRAGALKSFEPAVLGLTNESWFLEAGERSYFLRRRNLSYQKESIEFELCLVESLAKSGFPVAAPLHTCSGASYVESGCRYWELYERIQKEKFDPENLLQVRSAARLLARFHMAGMGPDLRRAVNRAVCRKKSPDLVYSLIDRFEEEIKAQGILGKALLRPLGAMFRHQADMAVECLQALPEEKKILIHGDFQPSNILFSGGEASVLLDFGDACIFYRAYDLAKALLRFSAIRQGYRSQMDLSFCMDMERMSTFVKEYKSEISSAAELALIDEEVRAIPVLLRGIYLYDTAFFMGKAQTRRQQAAILIRAFRFMSWISRRETIMAEILAK